MMHAVNGTGHHVVRSLPEPDSAEPARHRRRPEFVAAVMMKVKEAAERELECRGDPVCRADVIISARPTQVGGDIEGPNGQGRLWVRQTQQNPTQPGNRNCSTRIECEIGVIRCHKPIEHNDALKTADTVEWEMWRAHEDKDAILAALMDTAPVEPGGWIPYGPQGNVVGGIWTFQWTVKYGRPN